LRRYGWPSTTIHTSLEVAPGRSRRSSIASARLGWVLKTLRWVEENEADIRIFIAQRNSRRIVDEITYAP